jgi:Toprim domain
MPAPDRDAIMPTYPPAAELARRLAEDPEGVCRRYLSNGRRAGRYWIVGDVSNSPGASLFVRLTGPTSGKGARGRWQDAATAEHGDLLDLIRLQGGHDDWRETLEEARAFLRLPGPPPREAPRPAEPARDTSASARRLFRAAGPVPGTAAAAYLRTRGVEHAAGETALRFHPRCYYHADGRAEAAEHPALLAAVTDLSGCVTAVSRTWLACDGRGKADLPDPRRALGALLGHGVRFPGTACDLLVAGEGIESVLSVHRLLPTIPHVAALSAGHLASLILPPGLRRLYVARDADEPGERAFESLRCRAKAEGVEVRALVPREDDFNRDLRHLGPRDLAVMLAPQLNPEDAVAHLVFEEEPSA